MGPPVICWLFPGAIRIYLLAATSSQPSSGWHGCHHHCLLAACKNPCSPEHRRPTSGWPCRRWCSQQHERAPLPQHLLQWLGPGLSGRHPHLACSQHLPLCWRSQCHGLARLQQWRCDSALGGQPPSANRWHPARRLHASWHGRKHAPLGSQGHCRAGLGTQMSTCLSVICEWYQVPASVSITVGIALTIRQ